MPKKSWINKKTAQHFTLVHRPQNDPLIHDENAPSMVLNPTNLPGASKSKQLDDLASELGLEADQIRANEGEAANYGVYYDDTEYDYMQHLRDLGQGGGDVVFVEADSKGSNRDKGKAKQKSLESALRELDIQAEEDKKRELFDDDFLPSKNLSHKTYQNMQDVPDVIAGFQPDMDPRLREVLEALEDEAYVDAGDNDDLFGELTKDGREIDDYEFEESGEFEDEVDDGWETDDTARPGSGYKVGKDDPVPDLVPVMDADEAAEAADTVNWMEDFKAFKKDQKAGGAKQLHGAPTQSDIQSSLMTTTTNGGRRKKRKGALTDTSSYSMTSSSLVRTEQLGLLDARFEKLEQQYNADMDDMSEMGSVSAVSTASTVDGPMRSDFDSMLDDFLGGYSTMGKKHMRKGGWKTGTEQYDEIRRELGPPRIKGKTTVAKKAGR
ncbi:low-temperature viability protein-like protein ltv1 [Xylariales sp. PMI_506]|nr:low-temperature viability protein-like protein ltv1 [Xylariales sp. PMI_506]